MKQKRLRVLKILGWSVLALLLALYVGLPTGMAIAAVWPSRAYVGEPPAGFREVPLTTEDGVELVAWYAPPNNGAVLILAHGAGGSREGGRQLATALAEYGFGVLSLDLRGHGESAGRTNRLGWLGTTDIRAAVDYITAHEGDVAIGGVGLSMGGEVLLGASATCPEVTAIVTDGATRRCTEELLALPSKRPLVENFTSRVMYGAVRLFSGERPPPPLLDEMARAASTRFLLIAAGNSDLE
ncbi:MAG TPA: alpha/beta fold hydrolase, partial [Coriobacteriia bacterium]|nr:alpha/beta fold hydrolase [Coriobacteriia bacterium]